METDSKKTVSFCPLEELRRAIRWWLQKSRILHLPVRDAAITKICYFRQGLDIKIQEIYKTESFGIDC